MVISLLLMSLLGCWMESGDYLCGTPTWCPGCGNFSIRIALSQALAELNLLPKDVLLVADVGCGGNENNWFKTYVFHSLHGRSLPLALGARIANPKLTVIAQAGDGGAYGEGLNHLLHACRINVPVVYLVHNNQLYSLTAGQASPTTDVSSKTVSTPAGVSEMPVNPIALAISAGASFVARGFSGDIVHLKELLKKAILHRGFALVDVLQPCITLNKVNTFDWYKQRIYKLDKPERDRISALKFAFDADKLPIGVLLEETRAVPVFDLSKEADVSVLMKEFS